MIQLLKWLGIVALVVTLAINMIYGSTITPQSYIGLFFGVAIVGWLTSFIFARKAFFQVIYMVELIFYFLWELIKASSAVAHEVVTPSHTMQPGIIAVPLDAKTNLEITIFSSMVTLTPVTLSLDVSADKSHLFVHAMYISKGNSAILIDELKNGFERRILRILH